MSFMNFRELSEKKLVKMAQVCSICNQGAGDNGELSQYWEKGLNSILANLRALNIDDQRVQTIERMVTEEETVYVHSNCRRFLDNESKIGETEKG